MTRRDSLRGTQGQILTLLRTSARTVNELAATLGLTPNAIRSHLTTLQRDGMVREAGWQRGASRPAVTYEVAPEAEAGFSKAYIPFVAQLMRVLQTELAQDQLDAIMQQVGRGLAAEWPRLRGSFAERVEAASALLEDLGALNDVEATEGGYLIRGRSCLLSAAVHERPEVCRSMETVLTDLLDTPVRECCDRGERPRCRFEIPAPDGSARPTATSPQGGP